MKSILIGGDLGFASIGISVATFDNGIVTPIQMRVIRTKKSNEGSVSEDNFNRARFIYHEILKSIPIASIDNVIIFIEAASASRDASAAGKVSLCFGVLAAIAAEHNIQVVQNSPQKIKKILCGKTSASKEEVEQALRNIFTTTDFDSMLKQSKVPKGLYEHAFDALGAIVAGSLSEGIDIRGQKC